MADEKRDAGRDLPVLNWRYILFNWNDSDEEMARRASWRPRSASIACAGRSPIIPEDALLAPLRAGHAELDAIRHEIWDDNNLGNAIPGATPRARIDVRGALPGRCRSCRAPATGPRRRRASEPVARGRFPRRRRTAAAWSASARSSATHDGSVDRPRLRAGVAAADARSGRRTADVRDRSAGAGEPGPLRAEVRSRQRRHRLVRGLRLRAHRPRARGVLKGS